MRQGPLAIGRKSAPGQPHMDRRLAVRAATSRLDWKDPQTVLAWADLLDQRGVDGAPDFGSIELLSGTARRDLVLVAPLTIRALAEPDACHHGRLGQADVV